MRKTIATILSIFVISISWQLLSMWINYPAIFPSLYNLLINVVKLFISEGFYEAIFTTILRGLLGLLLSLIFAFIFATMATFSYFWKAFFHPLLVILRSIPVISIVLIALLWFTPPYLPVFIAIITTSPILYQSILNGLESTDIKIVEMAKVFGKSKLQIYNQIYLPSAKNIIAGGVSTAMGFGWRTIIIGEVLAQPLQGIGTSMKKAQAYINVSELIAWTVVAVIISYVFELLFKKMCKINFKLKCKNYQLKTTDKNIDIKEITVQNITKHFNNKLILDSFSISFNSSKINCIKAPSGKGKTTLLQLVCGIKQPDSGTIKTLKNYSYAYSFQEPRLIPWLTIEENICFTLNYNEVDTKSSINKKAYIEYFLRKVELSEHLNHYPNQLSGGQQQRVSLARALSAQSDVLLLDEPLNGLDDSLKIRIIDFIGDWTKSYKPLIIWSTHEDIEIKGLDTLNHQL